MAAPPPAASQAWTEETQVKEGDDKKPITRIVRHFVFSVSLLFFFIFITEMCQNCKRIVKNRTTLDNCI